MVKMIKNVNSLSFSRGVVRPGVTGQEDLLVCEPGQGPARPAQVAPGLHGEAGAEPGPELEESAPGIKLVAGITPGESSAVLARGGRALTQQGDPGAPGRGAGDTCSRPG